MNAQRRRWGIEVIPWRNLRRVFSALREPAILGLVVDWGYRADGIPVRLFGEWTALPAGPAMLAAQDQAPRSCPSSADGCPTARTRRATMIRSRSPIRPDAEMQRATQKIADALEDMISTAPEQWYSSSRSGPRRRRRKRRSRRRAVGGRGAAA